MKSPSDHIESVQILLAEIPASLSGLHDEYNQCVMHLTVTPKFRTNTQSFLGQLRAILDYLAHDIARFCSRPPNKVYFPIAKAEIPKAKFEENLAKKWLPGLDKTKPDLFDYLLKLQHFYQGNNWLPAFHELSNRNKHICLSRMEIGDCRAALIRFHGKPVMQIGSRGFESFEIQEGGILQIRAGNNQAAIRGPQIVDRDTKKLIYADPGLDIITATWTEFKFNEYPSQPAIMFLELAEREVRQISEKVETFL